LKQCLGSILILLGLVGCPFNAYAGSCLNLESQESAGVNLVLQEAKAEFPNRANELQFTVSQLKEHFQTKWDHYWYLDQPDYLTFNIVVGRPSPNSRFPYSPAVAYHVTVDTNCKASAQLLYTIE